MCAHYSSRKKTSQPPNNAVTLPCRKGKSLVFHTRLNHKNVLRIKIFTWRKIANRKKKRKEKKKINCMMTKQFLKTPTCRLQEIVENIYITISLFPD